MLRPTARFVTVGLAFAACLAAPVAFGGFASPWQVGVNTDANGNGDGTGNIWGNLSGARYSSDGVEYIGCDANAWAGTYSDAYCYARDSTGNYGSCMTTDPDLIANVRGINETGSLDIYYDASGNCTAIFVSHQSQSLP
jgi:hypothetical protein